MTMLVTLMFSYTHIGIFQLILTDCIVWLCICALYQNSKNIRWPLLGLMVLCVLCGAVVVAVVGSDSKGQS